MVTLRTNLSGISGTTLILGSAVGLLLTNYTFLTLTVQAYPWSVSHALYLLSVVVLLGCVNTLILATLCNRYTIKPVIMLVFLIAAALAYFMDTYQVIIDDMLLESILRTDSRESSDLFNLRFILYFVLLGVIPAIIVGLIPLKRKPFRQEVKSRLLLVSGAFGLMVLTLVSFGNFYASYFREHKSLRYYANPSYFVYSVGYFLGNHLPSEPPEFVALGEDAHVSHTPNKHNLVILVVGETARADRFSLNGYMRDTNPELQNQQLYSFTNMWSCGTTTATSVPCMFSMSGHDDFDLGSVPYTENVLDVIHHAGVNVLWRDNNSDSKSVALRVDYQPYMDEGVNLHCDTECRDEGLLDGLQSYIDAHAEGDVLIVLHQMGNHGPAYYKRYPDDFERFTPVCKTNLLESCSDEEIDNAYDNAILYTDHFLAQVIGLLKQNTADHQTAMLYVSDHGESLGENHLYLHGMPYLIAPREQKHIPMLLWLDSDSEFGHQAQTVLPAMLDDEFTHDNIAHTLLGLLDVQTDVYDQNLDILHFPVNPTSNRLQASHP